MFSPYVRLALAAALLDAALLIGMTAVPFHLYHSFEGTAQTSGVIGGLQAGLYAAACLLSGRILARAVSPLKWGATGIFLCGTLFLMAWFQSNLVLFTLLFCFSLGMLSFTWPAMHSWIGADPDPHSRGRHMAAFNMAWSIGLAAGAFLGGFLYAADPMLPFLVYFGICMVSGILVLTLPDEGTMHDQSIRASNLEHGSYDQKGERLLVTAWIANGICMGLASITRMVFPKHIENLVSGQQLRLFFESTPPEFLNASAPHVYSVIAFGLYFASAAVFFSLGYTRKWHHRLDFLVLVQTVGCAALYVLGATNSVIIMALSFLFIGMANGAAFFAAVYYCMSNISKRHARTSINEFAVGAGSALGPIAAGVLSQLIGLGQTFFVVPAAAMLIVLVQAMLVWRTPITPEPTLSTSESVQ